MADWRKTIKDGVKSVELCGWKDRDVKIHCYDKNIGDEVYKAITTHEGDLSIAPKKYSGAASNRKNFTVEFDSEAKSKAFRETLSEIMNMDFSSGVSGSGTSGVSGSGISGIPGISGGSSSVIPVIPVEEGSNKTTIYIVVGIVLLLAALVGLVIWKKRK